MKGKFKRMLIAASAVAAVFGAMALQAGAVDVNATIDIGGAGGLQSFVTPGNDLVIDGEGCLRVTYVTSDVNTQVHLVVNPDWKPITSSSPVATGNANEYYLDYDYSVIENTLNGAELTGVAVETWGLWSNEAQAAVNCPVTVKSIDWISASTESPAHTGTELAYGKASQNMSIDGSLITEGGNFVVTYEDDSSQVGLYFSAICGDGWEWSDGITPTSMTSENGVTTAVYSYDAVKAVVEAKGYTMTDFHDVVVSNWGYWDSTAGAAAEVSVYLTSDVRYVPAETATEANSIGATKDGSLGYWADVKVTDSAVLSNPVWRVTSSTGSSAEIPAKVDKTTITNTTITVGLVLTAKAVGNNTITRAEFVY